MTTTPINAAHRGAFCKSILDIFRAYSLAYAGHDRIGERSTDLIIGCAVMVGHSENRPMTAAKIGEYIGLPRTTVLRRLKAMERAGIVVSIKHNGRSMLWINNVNKPNVLEIVMQSITKALALYVDLSKMDVKSLDRECGKP